MQYRSVNEIAKKWNIPENAAKPERSNKKKEQLITLLDILQEERKAAYSGGIYHKIQIELNVDDVGVNSKAFSLY